MADRITQGDLQGTAETVQLLMQRAGIISATDTIQVSSGLGGYRMQVRSTGTAGLGQAYAPARQTYVIACAVIAALSAALRGVR